MGIGEKRIYSPQPASPTIEELREKSPEDGEVMSFLIAEIVRQCVLLKKMNLGCEGTREVIEKWFNEGWLKFDLPAVEDKKEYFVDEKTGESMGYVKIFVFNPETGKYDINIKDMEHMETQTSKALGINGVEILRINICSWD